jgi:hypothetical protein
LADRLELDLSRRVRAMSKGNKQDQPVNQERIDSEVKAA